MRIRCIHVNDWPIPAKLAAAIVAYAKTLVNPFQQIRFLDPAFGTGSFYAALLRSFPASSVTQSYGYEQALNEITPDVLMNEGRVYGGGLYKLEPKELANAPADGISALFPGLASGYARQLSFLD